MRHFITRSLELFCNIAIVLIVVASVLSGANTGGIGGALAGLLSGVVISVILFGALFLLMDIADNTRRTAELLINREAD